MGVRRENSGFQPLGAPDLVGGLDLPSRRARDLRLQVAWLDVAGEAVAARVRPIRVVRGVVELAIDDARWVRQLADLLPAIAGRLAASAPALGIRRYRLIAPDGAAEAVPIGPPAGECEPERDPRR